MVYIKFQIWLSPTELDCGVCVNTLSWMAGSNWVWCHGGPVRWNLGFHWNITSLSAGRACNKEKHLCGSGLIKWSGIVESNNILLTSSGTIHPVHPSVLCDYMPRLPIYLHLNVYLLSYEAIWRGHEWSSMFKRDILVKHDGVTHAKYLVILIYFSVIFVEIKLHFFWLAGKRIEKPHTWGCSSGLSVSEVKLTN